MQSLYALHFYFISQHDTTSFTFHRYYTLIIGGETVKQYISLAAAALLVFFLSTCARRPEEPEPDYLGMMIQAAQQGDVEAGRQAQELWELSLAENKREETPMSFDQLYLLSRLIHFKYGHYRYSNELRMCAGEVILNRMASAEYPDTMEEVIFQKGINEEVFGVPVIAVGVPLVVHAATISRDVISLMADKTGLHNDEEKLKSLADEVISESLGQMIVTPKDIDSIINDMSKIIADAINMAVFAEKYQDVRMLIA